MFSTLNLLTGAVILHLLTLFNIFIIENRNFLAILSCIEHTSFSIICSNLFEYDSIDFTNVKVDQQYMVSLVHIKMRSS